MRQRRYDTRVNGSLGAARREVMAAIGMLVLLANVLTGWALEAPGMVGNRAFADFARDRNVICSSSGANRDGSAQADEENGERQGHDPQCLFCLPLSQGNLLAPALTALTVPNASLSAVSAAFASTTGTARPADGAWSARGPPTS